MTNTTRLIVGCGYVGKRVAERWLANGDSVLAISRTRERASALLDQGIRPIVWDWLHPEMQPMFFGEDSIEILKHIQTILVSASHSLPQGVASGEAHARGLANLFMMLSKSIDDTSNDQNNRWIYLSTTGVYAPAKQEHAWVDEESLVAVQRPGAHNAIEGERWIERVVSKDRYTILRPAGIYGPGRIPNCESIRNREPLNVNPESFLNLIHVDDLASIIVEVSKHDQMIGLYNVTDGCPVERREYYRFISETLRLPDPIFEWRVDSKDTDALKPNSRSESSKRVCNQRLMSELKSIDGFAFRFPTYREGLLPLFDKQQST